VFLNFISILVIFSKLSNAYQPKLLFF